MKKLVKTFICKLPFGLGESVVLPAIIAVLNFSSRKIWKRRHVPRKEARNIQRAMACGIKEFVLVFDDAVSALAFGEFLNFLIVARYVMANGYHVRIFIIPSSGGREDFAQYMDSQPVKAFLGERLDLARAILASDLSSVTCMSWDEYLRECEQLLQTSHIVFGGHVQRRESIYNHCFNLIDALLKGATKELQEKTLLSGATPYQQKQNVMSNELTGGYITLACRYNKNWRLSSNLDEEEFCDIVKMLNAKFPDRAVLIVSDGIGCSHFRQMAIQRGLRCSFSSDISPGFLGSMRLVLGSTLFVQFNGGGIAMAAIYSQMPYFINTVPANELIYSKNKVACWATGEQQFINSPHFSKQQLEMFLQKLEGTV